VGLGSGHRYRTGSTRGGRVMPEPVGSGGGSVLKTATTGTQEASE